MLSEYSSKYLHHMHTEIYPEIGNVIVPNLFLINTHEKTSTIGEKRETIIAVTEKHLP